MSEPAIPAGALADSDDEAGWEIELHGRMIDFADDPDTGGVETVPA